MNFSRTYRSSDAYNILCLMVTCVKADSSAWLSSVLLLSKQPLGGGHFYCSVATPNDDKCALLDSWRKLLRLSVAITLLKLGESRRQEVWVSHWNCDIHSHQLEKMEMKYSKVSLMIMCSARLLLRLYHSLLNQLQQPTANILCSCLLKCM